MLGEARFQSFDPAGRGWNLHLAAACEVRSVRMPAEVPGLLRAAEQAAREGNHVAVAVSYEAAAAFDPAMRVPAFPAGGLSGAASAVAIPLAWMAVHPEGESGTPPAAPEGFGHSPWRSGVDVAGYREKVAAIREAIRQGESYQINYTVPFTCHSLGDFRGWHARRAQAQGAGYSAYLDMGSHQVACFSPELFFRRQGDAVTTRPMKGTMPRGRGAEADRNLARRLAACPKNRAENVMIVDLLRSDLGRVALPGSVRVESLFQVEAYRTVWQMTSTVTARLRPGVGLAELFAALFPCGSVTGAPKLRSMELIAELEGRPRGVYCGALGFLRPGGDAVFNVPIRTVQRQADSGQCRFDVGGGVTWDSRDLGEFAEMKLKMRFLRHGSQPVRLLEALLLADGRYALLERHLARLAASAVELGYVFPEDLLRAELAALAREHSAGRHKVRVELATSGRVRCQGAALEPSPARLRVGLALREIPSRNLLLRHKTSQRDHLDAALAARPDCHDVVLVDEEGWVCESTRANLVLRHGGELVTPPLDCGLLPGVLRGLLLERGVLREARVHARELAGTTFWLVNAVRGWMPARLVPGEVPAEPPRTFQDIPVNGEVA